jgi:hypothetical protein
VVDRVRDRPGLIELRSPVPVREVVWHSKVRGQATVELAVAVIGLLVEKEIASFFGSLADSSGLPSTACTQSLSVRRAGGA